MNGMPAVTPVRDVIARGDHVCWADPHASALHEGIVGRVFDRFVEVAHRDGCARRPTMVYKSRVATIAHRADSDQPRTGCIRR
jgi:hypothetical protein